MLALTSPSSSDASHRTHPYTVQQDHDKDHKHLGYDSGVALSVTIYPRGPLGINGARPSLAPPPRCVKDKYRGTLNFFIHTTVYTDPESPLPNHYSRMYFRHLH